MEQKIYRVLNTFDYKKENKIVHEYNIMVHMNKNGHQAVSLHRSHDDVWAEDRRGEQIFSLIDTGDMIIYPKKMFAGDVDYAAHAELFILLSFINKTEFMPLYEGVIEEITPKETYVI
jgi:hypothetical protein